MVEEGLRWAHAMSRRPADRQAGVPAESMRASSACSKQLSSSARALQETLWGAGLNCRTAIEAGSCKAAERFANFAEAPRQLPPLGSWSAWWAAALEEAIHLLYGQNVLLLISCKQVQTLLACRCVGHQPFALASTNILHVLLNVENKTHYSVCFILPSSPLPTLVNALSTRTAFISTAPSASSWDASSSLGNEPDSDSGCWASTYFVPVPSFWCPPPPSGAFMLFLPLSWNVSLPQARPPFISPHLLIINMDPNGSCSSWASKLWHVIILTVCVCVSLRAHTAVSAAAAKTPRLVCVCVCDSLKHADVSAAETLMRSPLSVKMTFNVPSVSGLKCCLWNMFTLIPLNLRQVFFSWGIWRKERPKPNTSDFYWKLFLNKAHKKLNFSSWTF